MSSSTFNLLFLALASLCLLAQTVFFLYKPMRRFRISLMLAGDFVVLALLVVYFLPRLHGS